MSQSFESLATKESWAFRWWCPTFNNSQGPAICHFAAGPWTSSPCGHLDWLSSIHDVPRRRPLDLTWSRRWTHTKHTNARNGLCQQLLHCALAKTLRPRVEPWTVWPSRRLISDWSNTCPLLRSTLGCISDSSLINDSWSTSYTLLTCPCYLRNQIWQSHALEESRNMDVSRDSKKAQVWSGTGDSCGRHTLGIWGDSLY